MPNINFDTDGVERDPRDHLQSDPIPPELEAMVRRFLRQQQRLKTASNEKTSLDADLDCTTIKSSADTLPSE